MISETYVIILFVGAFIVDICSVLSRSAIVSFSLADMEELLRKRDRIQQMMPKYESFAEDARDIADTFLFVIQLAKALSVCSIYVYLQEYAPSLQLGFLGTLGVTLASFVCLSLGADTIARVVGAAYPERICMFSLPLWRIFYVCMYVCALPIRMVDRLTSMLLNRGDEDQEEDQAEDDIIAAVALGEAQGHIHEEERDMIEAVLELRDKCVADVMSPRTDMAATPLEDGTEKALDLIKESGHSRLPVYQDNRDNIVGVLYAKDLIGLDRSELPPLQSLLKEPVLVPETKGLVVLLREMRSERKHLAVVLDEFGGTSGLITIEDIIEEVFGEIEDEYDTCRGEEVRKLDEETYDLDARLKVEDINERFDYNLPLHEKSYESLGGLITTHLGCIPQTGAVWEAEDATYKLTVLEATPRRVVRVCLERQDTVNTEDT